MGVVENLLLMGGEGGREHRTKHANAGGDPVASFNVFVVDLERSETGVTRALEGEDVPAWRSTGWP
jgi:hypothetical protein